MVPTPKDFKISQSLVVNHRYRKPHLIAFQYNNTDDSFNSSTVVANGFKFLALEAPSKASIDRFLNLIHNVNVTHVVRLTPATEGGSEKCYPYWEGNVETSAEEDIHHLIVRLESEDNDPIAYRPNYIWVDSWKDGYSGSPEGLLELIMKTRKNHDASSLVAVHCHSGVSRTGTFIAGFILLDEIDRQVAKGVSPKNIKVSVEKVVTELSLQRFYMVGQPKQYLTLYRLVDLYVKKLST